jgi:hypothetical protein
VSALDRLLEPPESAAAREGRQLELAERTRLEYHEAYGRGNQLRVHGNGFVQFDLADDGSRRLHVWDESVPRQETATPVHDHVFAMRSTVLCGKLLHTELEALPPRPHDTARSLYAVHEAVQEEGTQNTELRPTGEVVRLRHGRRLALHAGETYEFPAGRFHTSGHRGLTATVMEKVDAPAGYGRPRVLVPLLGAPDNAFRRDGHDEGPLLALVGRALELAFALERE